MRLTLKMFAAAAVLASVMSCIYALPQTKAGITSSVPFVGCASDGQVGPRKAPHEKPRPYLCPLK